MASGFKTTALLGNCISMSLGPPEAVYPLIPQGEASSQRKAHLPINLPVRKWKGDSISWFNWRQTGPSGGKICILRFQGSQLIIFCYESKNLVLTWKNAVQNVKEQED